ncbi:hypothetical protein KC669_00740 [Candidatus Dojkabacteria bacterium]|uniref:Uncharacterized protein n=1 Tax=Candidatus Dojkabacteria bacterium TaxID=2099670 RepID=A0A955LAI6_9BACT|nr:hypothetical protein [Candidatus Dojkabacteria bacterium]
MQELNLPEIAWQTIDGYRQLSLGGKQIACPYFINIHKAKDLRAMVGKGTPEEIEIEAKMWEKLKGVKFDNMSVSEIRQFLIDRGIGIDCSGFVMHVLNEWYRNHYKKPIWGKLTIPNKSILHKISYILKPVQKLGAEIITNKENSKVIKIKDALPGDLIRSKWKRQNGHHVLLISRVLKDDNGHVTEIDYINSTEQYGNENGVRIGKIKITNQNGKLQDQHWIDEDTDGTNHTYEGFMVNVEDNGIRRIRAMEKLQKGI